MPSMVNSPVRIGLLAPLSGIVDVYGQEISWAAKIATEMVNERGGVLGRPLELLIADDGSVPETAVPAARELIHEHKCEAIIGNLLSNSRISVAYQVAEPLQVPYLNFSFYEGSILSPYFFSFSALPNQQIDKMIPYMVERFGPKVMFAGSDYEWPRGSIDAAKHALLKSGGEIVGEEYYPLGEADLDDLMTIVSRSGADIFIPYFAGKEQIDLLNKFTEAGLKDRMAVVMGHYDEKLVSFLEPEVRQNFFSTNSYFMSVDTKANRDYLRRLEARKDVDGIWPKGDGCLTNFGEGTFVCVFAYANAVNKAGTLEKEAVLEALRSVEVEAPQGTVIMTSPTQHADIHGYLARCRYDGSFEIVEDFGREKPIIPQRYRSQNSEADLASDPCSENDDNPTQLDEEAFVLGPTAEKLAAVDAVLTTQFSTALNIAEVGVVAINAAGEIMQLNKVAEDMFGYDRSELIGHSINILIPPRSRASHGRHVRKFAAAKASTVMMGQRGEISGYTKAGREFPAEASIFKFEERGEIYYAAILREISKYKEAEEALRWQASHDGLTRLPNRAALVERLSNALGRARRDQGDIALLFIDLDDFKLVNDSYGHSVGDLLLETMAERLLGAVRAGDTVARFGGDEFVVLCEKVENESSMAFLAERINQELRRPLMVEGMELFPTCSIGLAISPDGVVNAKELLSNADAAMYQAKEAGRDGWIAFNSEIHEKARERLNVANGLRKAIENDELHCVFQPIVETKSGKLRGVETLVRWEPSSGPVSPTVFIPVAEMIGAIQAIGAWVFERACEAQVALAEMLGQDECPYVSVNVSPRQLEQLDFFENICRTCFAMDANAKNMLIEVTETALMSDVDHNLRVLNALGGAGFGIAIDDFGTGYSSLSLLTKMPLSVLKVDRVFVSKLVDSKTDLAVATAVIGLAHSLGLKVIAEGVENGSQRQILSDLNAGFSQGYLFSKPLTFDDLMQTDFIKNARQEVCAE